MTRKNFYRTLALFLCTALLGACSIYVNPEARGTNLGPDPRFEIELSDDIIERFAPDRGAGASYDVGDTISFDLYSSRQGYVTLSVMGPDGNVDVLAEDVVVQAGQNEIPAPEGNIVFTLQPPRGLHEVRAVYTLTPFALEPTNLEGVRGQEAWGEAIERGLAAFEPDERDVATTFFYLR
jgi:hypothetical protein